MRHVLAFTAVLLLLAPATGLAKPRARAAGNVPDDKIMHTVYEIERDEHTLRFESWHGDDISIGRATERLMAGSIDSHRSDRAVLTEPGSLVVEEASDGRTCETYNGNDTITRRRCGSGFVVASLAGYERGARYSVEHADRFGDRQTIRRITYRGTPAYSITARYMRDGEVDFTSHTVVARRDYALLAHRQSASRRGAPASVLRIITREFLPRTEENERLMRMNHPHATVREG